MATTEKFDFVVIGSGLAGLSFALSVAEHGSVCILTKAEISDSNTQWAQGGIAAAVGESDTWSLHEQDTMIAGGNVNDHDAVRYLVQNAPAAIDWLVSLGARFDREHGELSLGREGGHSTHRIVKHADKTGWEVERTMVSAIRKHKNIHVYEKSFVTALLVEDGVCRGCQANVNGLGERVFAAKAVMLATGGCGRMYLHTTNPRVATGDGIGLASAVGAEIRDMEFMQFHPTTLYHPQMRSFLITEAVRGAGGTLRNHHGRRFMYDYDPRLELAPRDVVARAIDAEMKKRNTWCVYLDTTHLESELLEQEFPTIFEKLKTIGIEMDRDWIPVVPAQHYSCGGVCTDIHGQTTIPGLYAAGEVSRTGVHGANRLASNSLLEAMVFAKAASESAVNSTMEIASDLPTIPVKCISEADSIRIRTTLQHQMMKGAGIVRTTEGLQQTLSVVADLMQEYDACHEAPFSAHPLETKSLLIASRYVAEQALARKTNIGLHYNLDLPTESVPSTPVEAR
ncbi:MAG: L-aspartate oxidase [Armatimonadetes bacterium]|nr:L-aspartate oxidase [Armatimonadota bacterium]MBS1702724.1 L-aspartate oxidase [Armatimonadota bacterium]MBS1726597.1 L-aspartate oxidase [Armatimonadota bacterium]